MYVATVGKESFSQPTDELHISSYGAPIPCSAAHNRVSLALTDPRVLQRYHNKQCRQ